MAGIFKFLAGAIIVAGLVIGIVYGFNYGFWLTDALAWWIGGLISGVVLYALSIIIEYLEAIYELIKDSTQTQRTSYPETGKSGHQKAESILNRAKNYQMKSNE